MEFSQGKKWDKDDVLPNTAEYFQRNTLWGNLLKFGPLVTA